MRQDPKLSVTVGSLEPRRQGSKEPWVTAEGWVEALVRGMSNPKDDLPLTAVRTALE